MRSTSISIAWREATVSSARAIGLGALAVAMAMGCTEMPSAGEAEDLSSLARRYEHPTATIPKELVAAVMQQSSDHSDLAQELDALRVIHVAVTDAATRLAREGDADNLDLQGTVDVVYRCPGYEQEPAASIDEGGAIRLTLSIKHSFIQRGLAGVADGCRFNVKRRAKADARVELNATLALDLGADSHIGSKIAPDLTVRLRDLKADISSDSAGVVLLHDLYDFRVNEQRVETLIDMWTIGFYELGTAVLIAGEDGSLSLRERRGEWLCGGAGDACELKR